MFVPFNPNPNGIYADDCLVRAISLITGKSWDSIYFDLCLQGYLMKNMPSVNKVWGNYLRSIGFVEYPFTRMCSDCYTVRDFCYDNPSGAFILATGSHVIAVIDGDYYDAWDSGDEMPSLVWRREIW